MKKRFLVPVLALSMVATVVSCKKDKPLTSESNEVETTTEGVVYVVDKEISAVNWKGREIYKGKEEDGHFGIIKFETADVTVKDGALESGKFVVDMNSLKSLDIKEEEKAAKLDGHLKNQDFFEVEKFPTATYEITKVSPAEEGADFNTILDGNLTIKGITKPVQFKANVTVSDATVEIATESKDINRQDFGVVYQTDMKDAIIKDEVNLQILVKVDLAK